MFVIKEHVIDIFAELTWNEWLAFNKHLLVLNEFFYGWFWWENDDLFDVFEVKI